MYRMRLQAVTLILISGMFLWHRAVVSGIDLSLDEREFAEFCMEGVISSRGELRTGSFTATESRRIAGRSVGSEETVSTITCTFDDGNLRFERKVGERTGKVVATRSDTYSYDDRGRKGQGILFRDGSNVSSHRFVRPFDVHGLGLLNLAELEKGMSIRQLFSLIREDFSLEEVERPSGGVARLTWHVNTDKGNLIRRSIWIDVENGFLPLKSRTLFGSPAFDDWDNAGNLAEMDVTWRDVDGVAVPTHCNMELNGGSETVELVFAWSDVNGHVPKEVFTLIGLELPDGTYVVDQRLGKPILDHIIGQTLEGDSLTVKGAASRYWLILANIAVVVLLLLLLVWRRLARAKA